MVSLDLFKPAIEKVITGFSDILNVDAAVINGNGQLVTSTERYLKQKGALVHVPSIELVLSQGQYLVDKPGAMDMCTGCRFSTHCPAKVELLSSIKVANQPIGVVSLTSFTKEGQNRLSKNTEKYQQILTEITEMITTIIHLERSPSSREPYSLLLEETLHAACDAYLTFDRNGKLAFHNAAADSYLRKHHLQPDDLSRMFSPSLAVEGDGPLPIANCLGDKLGAPIEASPIIVDNQFVGGVLKIVADRPQAVPAAFPRPALPNRGSLDKIIGTSPAVNALKQKTEKIKNSSSTVLITGETGTGKGHLARAIHEASNRAYQPFVAINCASIPENLFESELFGYEEGAFTGAKKGGKPGRFELAHGGTLFLDEIGDMPLAIQPKLLRVLQEMTLERVGGTRSIPIDVRIIAATNHDLEELVAQKKFRADLYYRLGVIPIAIPSLRERLEDVPLLAESFLHKCVGKTGKAIHAISHEALERLQRYTWPGNVRELENAIEYAMNMESEDVLTADSLPDRIRMQQTVPAVQASPIKAKLADVQIEAIRQALQKHGSDLKGKQEVARELGIGIRTLYRKLKAYQLT
ncbi:AAA family ATPase [Brevibacillus fluminis]|uniref:AAA family ATPase n=1 Tax=Brevibacillus fluminis TaxID=511487 RepID=A0A3M8DNJ3_9BACL|nr:sigma 54-interacting transcriptional regulator [Brevibacillus fluminis]RNB89653.1 AAA family ATPase [Brevibacillus fluminis]